MTRNTAASAGTVASALAGAALLVGAPLAWYASQPPDTVGDVPVPATAPVESDPPPSEPSPPAEPAPERSVETGGENRPDAVAASALVERPTGLRVPAIGVDAPVVPVGLEEDRSMEIPHDVATIGWYELGVMPGEQGTAVLSGHVDSRSQGRGAFWDLRRLDVDDVVTIDHEDGTTSEWRVTARTVYPKDALPIADIFTRFGDTRVVLITCGGAFDNTARSYDDNVVVYTEPIGA